MTYVLIYDIESDRLRNKVAQACEEAGLERVQFSAFWGDLSPNRCEELLLRCQEIIGDETARVHILPVCAQCFGQRRQFATGAFKGTAQAPRDRKEPVVFLPETAPEVNASGRGARPAQDRAPAPSPEACKPGPVARAQADVARKLRRKDKPVGLHDDPWEETPDD